MALTRSTARDLVTYRLGNRTDLTSAWLDTRLDEGATELATRIIIGNLETTDTSTTFTNGSSTLAFPTGFVAVTHIYNTTKDKPLYGPVDWIKMRDQSKSSGDPTIWSARENTIYFNALADSSDTLDIAGQKRPTWTAGDAGTLNIDAEYEYGALLLATLKAARLVGNYVVADRIEDPKQGARGEFMSWVAMNNFPRIEQDLQPHADGLRVNLTGYDIME